MDADVTANADAGVVVEVPLRRLNGDGVRSLSEWLSAGAPGGAPAWMLTDPGLSEPVADAGTTVRAGDAVRRIDLARRVHAAVGTAGVLGRVGDVGFWSWLALLFHRELLGAQGDRTVGAVERFVLADPVMHRRRGEHLVRSACLFYEHFGGEDTIFVLSGRPNSISTIEREMLKRHNSAPFLRNPEFMRLVNMLYGRWSCDGEPHVVRGASSENRDSVGVVGLMESLRAFHGGHPKQTRNLRVVDAETMADLLPPAFEELRSNMRRTTSGERVRQRRWTLKDMVEDGHVLPGTRIRIRGRPDSEAEIVDGRHVRWNGGVLKVGHWANGITGNKMTNIYRTCTLEDGRGLGEVREAYSRAVGEPEQ